MVSELVCLCLASVLELYVSNAVLFDMVGNLRVLLCATSFAHDDINESRTHLIGEDGDVRACDVEPLAWHRVTIIPIGESGGAKGIHDGL